MGITAKCRDDAQSRMLGASSARPRQTHDGGGVTTPADTELHKLQEARAGWAGGVMSLRFHPLAEIFPLIEDAQFDELVADIKANGLIEPVVVLDNMILDGRNRYRACFAAGVEPAFTPFRGNDPIAYVISVNIRRRHLTTEHKRELVAKLIKAQPEKSNRQIAKAVKVDHKTVGAARSELEGRGEIPHVEARTDTKGRRQPATKVKVEPDELVAAAAEVGISETVIEAHGPQQAEAIRRMVQRKKRTLAKEQKEKLAVEIERLASKLIELDRDTARAVYDLLWKDDRLAFRLTLALGRGLGLDDDGDDGSASS